MNQHDSLGGELFDHSRSMRIITLIKDLKRCLYKLQNLRGKWLQPRHDSDLPAIFA